MSIYQVMTTELKALKTVACSITLKPHNIQPQ